MIEETVLTYLSDVVGVPAYMELPEDPPETCLVCQKTGSSVANHIYSATFAVQSYAPSLYEAAQLNQQVRDAMDKFAELDTICASRLNSDYNYTDTANKRHRYQAVFDITHY